MKKFYIFLALVLCGFSQMIYAQNMYRNYQSNLVPRPSSAVSVVHHNGYVYFFQANENNKISVTEIDPLNMNPTGSKSFFIQQNYHFRMNGGFENANGNFVIFGDIHGYIGNNYYKYPAYLIITSNFSFCDVCFVSSSYGEFTAGCLGFDANGYEVYMFVNDGELVAINAANPTIRNKIYSVAGAVPRDNYTDISWDDNKKHFIATGSARNTPTGHEDPFVEIFDLVYSSSLFFYTINPITEYLICDPTLIHANEYKSLHVQLDNDNLILYHDLRLYGIPNDYDMIWLTRIKDFSNIATATISESWIYRMPNTKLSAKDMIYDTYNRRLNFLGYYNHCIEGLTQILAQVNPFFLSSGIHLSQLGASFTGGTCQDTQDSTVFISYNDFDMFNLALSSRNPCHPVLIAGIGNKNSILTETYDISLSSCDIPLGLIDHPVNPIPIPYSLNITYQPIPLQNLTDSVVQDVITVNIMCDEQGACSHQFGGKALHCFSTNSCPTARVFFENNHQFVCEGFEGNIEYFLYDVTGKLLQKKHTQNGERNTLDDSNGVYLLRVVDPVGNLVIKKLVLF